MTTMEIPTENYYGMVRRKELADQEILALLKAKTLDLEELRKRKCITPDQYGEFMKKLDTDTDTGTDGPQAPCDMERIDPSIFQEVPPIIKGRYDVFVLGLAASGKSCFLAGLLHYGNQSSRLRVDNENRGGFAYASALRRAVFLGCPLPATPVTDIQYISCDFIESEENAARHPLNLLEMSGEVFESCWGKSKSELMSPSSSDGMGRSQARLAEYLFNENEKIIFLAIDCGTDPLYEKIPQNDHFDNMMQNLKRWGVLNRTAAICILVTKWDLNPDTSDKGKQRFLEKEYKSLVSYCRELEEEFDFYMAAHFFSLGEFEPTTNRYTFQPRDSERIFDWLCDATGVIRQRKRGFFRRLFE